MELERINGRNVDLVLKTVTQADPEKLWVASQVFDIVIHATDIIVGEIDARLGFNERIRYAGNIGYTVDEKWREVD